MGCAPPIPHPYMPRSVVHGRALCGSLDWRLLPELQHGMGTCRIARTAAKRSLRPRPPPVDQLFLGSFVGSAGATSTSPATLSGALYKGQVGEKAASQDGGYAENRETRCPVPPVMNTCWCRAS